MPNGAQHACHHKPSPLPKRRRLPIHQSQWQAEQSHGDRLPHHNDARLFCSGEVLCNEERSRKHGRRSQHDQVVPTPFTRQVGNHHHQHACKANRCRDPAVFAHGFAQEPRSTQHDENRAGEANGRHVRQGDLGQCNEPQHQTNGVHAAAPKLPLHVIGHIGRQALVPKQWQHDQEAAKIPEKLRFKRVHLHGKGPRNGVQQRERQASQCHPCHAPNGGWQAFKTAGVLETRES